MSEYTMKPIWYFVGLILLATGCLIFGSGIYQLLNPPLVKTVLADTHPNIWWGGLMIVFGGGMFLKTRKQSR
jgi:hypothetical protein